MKNLLRENTKITTSSILHSMNNTLLMQVGRSIIILLIMLQMLCTIFSSVHIL